MNPQSTIRNPQSKTPIPDADLWRSESEANPPICRRCEFYGPIEGMPGEGHCCGRTIPSKRGEEWPIVGATQSAAECEGFVAKEGE